MKLIDRTLTDFIDQTSGLDPVPGGGSISALAGSIAGALAHMVSQLTIGKKKYAEVEDEMKEIATKALSLQQSLIQDIDRDSDAYNVVFEAFKMPKETEEEKAARSEEIQRATKIAASVPMEVAEKAFELIPLIEAVVTKGNQNAITDGCVAMMCCRTAVLGALLNVRINLGSLKDQEFVAEATSKAEILEKAVDVAEKKILALTYKAI